jgi:predicted RNA-binding Zn-ribbon protein involved in translation (DUF1610 family)
MPLIPLECPSCGIEIITDSDDSAAICSHCGKPFIVKDAIVRNYIRIVTGTGKCDVKTLAYEEFIIEGEVLKRYNGSSPCVVIPDEVSVIGSKAFEDCRDITEVRLSDSVTEIEDNAFAGCDNLKKVFFADALKKIGGYAFSECTCLETVEFPVSVEEVGPYAFSGCFMLNSVRMPSSQAAVHETAFMGDRDVSFDWPEDWNDKQLDKLKIAAPVLGGMIDLCDSEGAVNTAGASLLFLGISDSGSYVESVKYNFYAYKDFMRMFSLEANNNDPYLLRVSVDNAQQRYDAIADIQKSYSELVGLLNRADISRSNVEMINIPHFIYKPGKRLNDYKVADLGSVPVFQLRLTQK